MRHDIERVREAVRLGATFHMTPAIFRTLSPTEQSYWAGQLTAQGWDVERTREFWFTFENPVITSGVTHVGSFRKRGGHKVEYLTGTKRI